MKVAFLDRDGVLNFEKGYVYKIKDFKFIAGSVDALKGIQALGYKIIIITNQSGIAKGFYTEEEYQKLTAFYLDKLKNFGLEILDVLHCPHHPEAIIQEYRVICNCRKPKPGMIEIATKNYSIDLSASFLIGDKISDLISGLRAGIGYNALVKSGHPIDMKKLDPKIDVYKDLGHFYSAYLLKRNNKPDNLTLDLI